MHNAKKDNLTDLVDDLTKPQEVTPPKPSEDKPNRQQKPNDSLDDYQVTTPDGEVIDLTLQKTSKSGEIKQILSGVDKKGRQYILVVQDKAS
jgi:hypothetical protein